MTINYLTVLLAAVASMVLGFLWYGPVFGKAWMRLSGKTMEDMKGGKNEMMRGYVLGFLASAVMAFILAFFAKTLGVADIRQAFTLSALVWIGFFATSSLSGVLWEKQPWSLYFLNIAYQFVNVFVMTAIVTLWA